MDSAKNMRWIIPFKKFIMVRTVHTFIMYNRSVCIIPFTGKRKSIYQ